MPSAIRYGVPYALFWDLTPKDILFWKDDYEDSVQEQVDMMDYQAWRIGSYVLSAIACAFEGKKRPYPREPETVTLRREKQESERRKENKFAADKFMAWANAYNTQNFKPEGGT